MHGFQLLVKDKGRVVIPVALRKQAALANEEELIATVLPEGGFTVRTRQQILTSLWAHASAVETKDIVSEHISESAAAYAQRAHTLDNPKIPSQDLTESEEAEILATLGL